MISESEFAWISLAEMKANFADVQTSKKFEKQTHFSRETSLIWYCLTLQAVFFISAENIIVRDCKQPKVCFLKNI